MDLTKKVKDARKADFVEKIAEKDFEMALKIAEEIEDVEAKIQALIAIFNSSGDPAFLQQAEEIAQTDEDLLRIVEYARMNDRLPKVASKILKPYQRDVAFGILLERTLDLNYARKIRDKRVLSTSLKRVALKLRYPEKLAIARMIPDAYYKCLALIEIAKSEKIDLQNEILDCSSGIKSGYLRKRIISLAKSLE
jgi:hypothetical protein